MKRQFVKTMQHIAALTFGVFLALGNVAQAADNTAVGDIAGNDPALVDSNTFTLVTYSPQLFKAAFLTSDNTALTTGDTLPAGTSVDFLIYLSNESDLSVDDVGIIDALTASGFTYVASSIHVLNTTAACANPCSLAEELNIYNLARVAGAKTDGTPDDEASFASGTVEVGDNTTGTNTQQDAAANLVLALVFTATID